MDYTQLTLIAISLINAMQCLPEKCIHIEYNYSKPVRIDYESIKQYCTENALCRRTYNITLVNFSPYSDHDIITPRLLACCGLCPNKTNIRTNILHLDNYDQLSSLDNTDFLLPVLGSVSKRTSYGYFFIPVVLAPDYFYITKPLDPVFDRLMRAISKVLPLVIICLLMAVLSGFITWSIETWNNQEEFPRAFLIGWFEGFWWSFISMTTVGYGDKTPKSVAGRLFAAAWILIGITLFGILTGLLTSAILSVNDPAPPSMKKAKVGVLQYRTRDESLVSRHDGIVVKTKVNGFFTDLLKLIEMLQKDQIDGFVLDKFAYRGMKSKFSSKLAIMPPDIKSIASFFLNDILLTQKEYPDENQAYGIIVKDEKVYEYFRDAIASNRIFYEIQIVKDAQERIPKPKKIDILSFSNTTFADAVLVMCSASLLIFIFGVAYKLTRAARCWRGQTTSPAAGVESTSSAPYSLSEANT